MLSSTIWKHNNGTIIHRRTGGKYLELLQRYIIPAYSAMSPNAKNYDLLDSSLWFKQKGATPHYFIINWIKYFQIDLLVDAVP